MSGIYTCVIVFNTLNIKSIDEYYILITDFQATCTSNPLCPQFEVKICHRDRENLSTFRGVHICGCPHFWRYLVHKKAYFRRDHRNVSIFRGVHISECPQFEVLLYIPPLFTNMFTVVNKQSKYILIRINSIPNSRILPLYYSLIYCVAYTFTKLCEKGILIAQINFSFRNNNL